MAWSESNGYAETGLLQVTKVNYSHSTLICSGIPAPSRGKPKPGPRGQDFLPVCAHRAPHLLCSRAFEVQSRPSACPAPRIYGTLVTLAMRGVGASWVFQPREQVPLLNQEPARAGNSDHPRCCRNNVLRVPPFDLKNFIEGFDQSPLRSEIRYLANFDIK